MFNDLCDEIIKIQGHRVLFAAFSRGKDSIALFLKCLESGKFTDYKLYYYYMIPDLEFEEESLSYFEKLWKIKITRVPSPTLYRMIHNQNLFRPLQVKAYDDMCKSGDGLFEFSHEDLMLDVRDSLGLSDRTLCAVGVKAADSSLRRLSLRKNGPISHKLKKWYPIHDLTNRDILDLLRKHNVSLPIDYSLFGLTFDGLDYRFLKVIKNSLPRDYQKIKDVFPLVDLLLARHERYFGTEVRRSQFSKLL